MTANSTGHILQRIRQLVGVPPDAEVTDGQLLNRYVVHREDDAFALLLQRHGPMVLGLCKRLIREPHAAEDAFQATFMVLVRKADSIIKQDSLASWLYGVAYRTARRVRSTTDRHRPVEFSTMQEPCKDAADHASWQQLRPVLDEEVNRLPEKFRAPVILCYIEGKSNDEAAKQLAWPVGTVKGRLSQARALLRGRLARRGLTLAGVTATVAATDYAAVAAVAPALAAATIQSARQVAAGVSLTTAASASVAALAHQTLRSMWMAKVAISALAIGAVVVPLSILGIEWKLSDSPKDLTIATPVAADSREKRKDEKNRVVSPPAPFVVNARIIKVEPHHLLLMLDGKEEIVNVFKETHFVDRKDTPLKDGLRNPHLQAGVDVSLTFAEKDGKNVCTQVKLIAR